MLNNQKLKSITTFNKVIKLSLRFRNLSSYTLKLKENEDKINIQNIQINSLEKEFQFKESKLIKTNVESSISNNFHLLPNEMEPISLEERLPKVYKDFEQPEYPKSLKLALIGPANAGKSTLLNSLIEDKVSTVSPRPQTTRRRTQGILTYNDTQLIFLDTPGVTTNIERNTVRQTFYGRVGKLKFNRELLNSPWRCLEEADHLLIIFDLWKLLNNSTYAEEFIFDQLNNLKINKEATLLFNKCDKMELDKEAVNTIVNEFQSRYKGFKGSPFFISASLGTNLDSLKNHLLSKAINRAWLFPKDIHTDISDYERVVETIRESFFDKLTSYLPYAFQQENIGWKEFEDGTLRVDQAILVTNPKHEKIMVGKGGKLINSVVQEATLSLRKQFKRKVKLYLHMKVVKKFPFNNQNSIF